MVYVPIVLTATGLEDKLFQNFYRLLDTHKYANTSLVVQDQVLQISYPANIIFIPDKTALQRDMKSNNQKRVVTLRVDFACLPVQGYRQVTLMSDSFEDGLLADNEKLYTARLRYKGSQTLFIEPLNINGQLVYTKAVEYVFEVLL
jgi:hypothetical protein